MHAAVDFTLTNTVQGMTISPTLSPDTVVTTSTISVQANLSSSVAPTPTTMYETISAYLFGNNASFQVLPELPPSFGHVRRHSGARHNLGKGASECDRPMQWHHSSVEPFVNRIEQDPGGLDLGESTQALAGRRRWTLPVKTWFNLYGTYSADCNGNPIDTIMVRTTTRVRNSTSRL